MINPDGIPEAMPVPRGSSPDPCSRCQHPMDPHVLVATGPTPMEGGVLLCPALGCFCINTWTPDGVPREQIRMPSQEELREFRANVQGGMQ